MKRFLCLFVMVVAMVSSGETFAKFRYRINQHYVSQTYPYLSGIQYRVNEAGKAWLTCGVISFVGAKEEYDATMDIYWSACKESSVSKDSKNNVKINYCALFKDLLGNYLPQVSLFCLDCKSIFPQLMGKGMGVPTNNDKTSVMYENYYDLEDLFAKLKVTSADCAALKNAINNSQSSDKPGDKPGDKPSDKPACKKVYDFSKLGFWNLSDCDKDGVINQCDNDADGDGIDNAKDNCPLYMQKNQNDMDKDGLGDWCDPDVDGDGIPVTHTTVQCKGSGSTIQVEKEDNCPYKYNPDQKDSDKNGVGDACDPNAKDSDGDKIPDKKDNCPSKANADQKDYDKDGKGDICDPDADGDGLLNVNETKYGSNPLNVDSDGDKLNDGDEVKNGCSPMKKDSDADGLDDYEEVIIHKTFCNKEYSDEDLLDDKEEVDYQKHYPKLSPTNSDSDDDGLDDWEELKLYKKIFKKLDPTNPDSDSDGLPDKWEIDWDKKIKGFNAWQNKNFKGPAALYMGTGLRNMLDPGDEDTDDDGLDDWEEVTQYFTEPNAPDSDMDMLIDGDEVHKYELNPTVNDFDKDNILDGNEVFGKASDVVKEYCNLAGCVIYEGTPLDPKNWDTDGDGLKDGDEVLKYKTNPADIDTDKDLADDGTEVALKLDPNISDYDKDGLKDGEEIYGVRAQFVKGEKFEYPWYKTDPFDPDTDKDDIKDGIDNCPLEGNKDQKDDDKDGIGNVCDDLDDENVKEYPCPQCQNGPACIAHKILKQKPVKPECGVKTSLIHTYHACYFERLQCYEQCEETGYKLPEEFASKTELLQECTLAKLQYAKQEALDKCAELTGCWEIQMALGSAISEQKKKDLQTNIFAYKVDGANLFNAIWEPDVVPWINYIFGITIDKESVLKAQIEAVNYLTLAELCTKQYSGHLADTYPSGENCVYPQLADVLSKTAAKVGAHEAVHSAIFRLAINNPKLFLNAPKQTFVFYEYNEKLIDQKTTGEMLVGWLDHMILGALEKTGVSVVAKTVNKTMEKINACSDK